MMSIRHQKNCDGVRKKVMTDDEVRNEQTGSDEVTAPGASDAERTSAWDDAAIAAGSHFRSYIVTPFEVFFDKTCSMIVIPAADGELGVKRGHAPLVTALYPGEVRIEKDGRWLYAFVSNGYVQIERDYVMVVCNSAEWADDIDPDRAQEALDRAQERYDNVEMSEPDRKRAAHAIRRAKNRLKVASRAAERKLTEN